MLLLVFCLNITAPVLSEFVGVNSIAQAASAQVDTADTDILGKIAEKYHKQANSWGTSLQDFAKRLFKYFLILDIIIFAFAGGLGIAYGGKTLGQVLAELMLNVVMPAAFMFCVITYYQPWSQEIIKGLSYIASSVEPRSALGASSFFKAGLVLFDEILTAFKVTDPSTWPLILAGLIILVVYALMAMQILLIKCESYIVLNAGIIILGLGAFAQTRSYATNFITYVLAIAVKLYVMQLIIGIAFSFVEDFLNTPPDMNNSIVVLGASIVMLGLIRVIPDMCAGIIQGQHVGSGNALAGAAAAVMGAAAGFAAGAVTGAGTASTSAKALSDISKAADVSGASGAGKAGFMAREMGKAAFGAAAEGGKGSYVGRLNSQMSARAQGYIKPEEEKK